MQTVYVDLLFFINFSMDFLCLFLVSKILFKKLSLLRALLGATFGGIYSILAFFLPDMGFSRLIIDVMCCALICLTVFAVKGDGIKSLIANCFTYFLSSVLLGGIMTAAFNLLNSSGIVLEGADGRDIPPWLTVSVGVASAIASYIGGRFIKRRSGTQTAHVTVNIDSKELSVSAMCDSGNLLRDSISGKPVIVADKKHIRHFFKNIKELDLNALDRLDTDMAKRIVLIPYSTASGSKTMIALRPQKLTVDSHGKPKEVDALIGFADINCTVDGCSALIPSELL